jgi:uncharacterized FAD-dependent dehydrogenase
MVKVQIQVLPQQLDDATLLHEQALERAELSSRDFPFFRVTKRSIDARRNPVKYNLTIELLEEERDVPIAYFLSQDVRQAPPVHIIGAGPGGLFAALQAIENGLRPILFERGKDVRARRRDLAVLNKQGIVHPESNYCFGEGGAGTYSDGKLYTRSKKRGDVLKSMQWLVHFGASPDILVDAHPHIGTNKLPQIITAIREEIIRCGGEVHFEKKLTDISILNQVVQSITLNATEEVPCAHVILATGHSARDIFHLLHRKGVRIEAKGFALGVRIEHPRALIDGIQYHGDDACDILPPASYSLVTQVEEKGVYSFCMCPGGIVAPCATAQEEVVTNGWSPSKRNNPWSNSGIVVGVLPENLPGFSPNDPFVALRFQQQVEYDCWVAGGKTQRVPAQRMIDFVEKRTSKDLPASSYQPGIVSVNLHDVLPTFIAESLRQAFLDFGRKMRGYLTNEAVIHAPESRTSSPVSIPRNRETFEHVDITGLYPCGEGAGYAGGIISAAVDGMNCANAIKHKIQI